MGDLTKNLSRHEFNCECNCDFDTVDFELIKVLQTAVDDFEKKYKKKVIIVITGGNRCKEHNDKLRELYYATGGAQGAKTAKGSLHIKGKAADHKFFIVHEDGEKEQIDPKVVYQYYDNKYPNKYGLGKYGNRTHIDSRSSKARW